MQIKEIIDLCKGKHNFGIPCDCPFYDKEANYLEDACYFHRFYPEDWDFEFPKVKYITLESLGLYNPMWIEDWDWFRINLYSYTKYVPNESPFWISCWDCWPFILVNSVTSLPQWER
jgi:hypothetical protein